MGGGFVVAYLGCCVLSIEEEEDGFWEMTREPRLRHSGIRFPHVRHLRFCWETRIGAGAC